MYYILRSFVGTEKSTFQYLITSFLCFCPRTFFFNNELELFLWTPCIPNFHKDNLKGYFRLCNLYCLLPSIKQRLYLCLYYIHIRIHPSPKVMADFFQTQKLTWCPHPICTIFGGWIKCMQVLIFCAKNIDFLHQPILHRGSKCGKRNFFQIKFEHHR